MDKMRNRLWAIKLMKIRYLIVVITGQHRRTWLRKHNILWQKKVSFFLSGGVGGAERMTVNIAQMLPPDKFDVSIVVIGRSFDILEFVPSSIPIKKLPSNKFSFLTFRIWWLIIQEKPDVALASSVATSFRVISKRPKLGYGQIWLR